MEKLSIQNVVDAYIEQSGASKLSADALSHAFFDVIVEGLNADGVVKINGFGTFKVVNVAARESVNVNNGERIVIEGYKKVSFTPADTVVTEVKPGSEPAPAPKKAKKTAAPKAKQAEAKEPEIKPETIMPEQIVETIVPEVKQELAIKEPIKEISNQQPNRFSAIDSIIATPESIAQSQNVAETVAAEQKTEHPEADTGKTDLPKGKSGSSWFVKLLIALFVIAVIAVCVYYFMFRSCNQQDIPAKDIQPIEVEEKSATEEVVVTEQPQDTTKQKTYVMKPGDYLAKISREQYGTTDSVAAIIRLNNITEPDSIHVGTTLLMP